MKAVFDTNILVDYLNGCQAAADELSLYDEKLISIITYIEVMVGVMEERQEAIVRGFLESFTMIDLSAVIRDESIRLRRNQRLKVPDAIVYATAKVQGCLIVSRNTKDLRAEWPDVRVPYTL